MKRRLASALLLASAITLPVENASALGLGKITLKSALNQPLSAEVELRKIGTLNEEQIIARLASNAEFDRSGVDRTFFHSEMRFKVEVDGQGGGTLYITTNTLVKEPYLDFLIEARWPKGRLVRGYTVLLDLPHVVRQKSSVSKSIAASQPSSESGKRSHSSISSPASSNQYAGKDAYTVQSGDSLWKIAKDNKIQGKSINETMSALYENNPDAFVDGDRNRLRAGAVMRLPNASSGKAVTQAPKASISATAVPDKPQLEAVEASSSPAAQMPEKEETGHLTLSSASDKSSDSNVSGAGEADNGAVQELEDALTQNEEQLALIEREKSELKNQLSSMEEEIKTLQELVDLKNNQLAEAQSGAETPTAQEPVVTTVIEDKPDDFSQWLKNPLTWVTSGIALILLLALAFFRRKPEEGTATASATPVSLDLDTTPEVDLDEASHDDQDVAELEDEEVTAGSTADGDAASEADIYIAYGRFDQAAGVLTRALDANPDDEAIRLKLAEVYVDGKMKDEFLALLSLAEDSGNDSLVIKMKSLLDGSPETQHWLGEEVTPLAEEESLDIDVGKLSTETDDSYTSTTETTEAEEDLAVDLSDEEVSLDTELDDFSSADDYSVDDNDLPGGIDQHSDLEDEAPLLDDFDLDSDNTSDSSLSDALALTDLEESGAQAKDEVVEVEPEVIPEPEPEPEPDFSDEEEVATKLELASAYIDMGDYDGARDILEEVLAEGNEAQIAEAKELLEQVD